MIKINKFFKLNILAVLLIGFLTVGVYSADSNPVADEMIGSSGISWVPKVNYSQMELTISRPDGTVFSKTFNSGSSLYASLSEIFGDSYMDGSYNYELRVTPVLDMTARSVEVDRYSGQAHKALIQSGGFFVQGGAIVNNDILEPGSEAAAGPISGAQDGLSGAKDIQHLDDVIISFSLCVGNDCVNGESFGFDTIRLKENNLRIKFQDTSNSASFPSNDWQITANDSSNGGANYFRIDDVTNSRAPFTIEAGTPNHTLYVDSAGRIGIGTSTPVVDIHAVSGNTPTMRLEQDGSSGFTPQTWDVAGNEANFFVRDVTNSSRLPFKIKPGAPTGSLFIAADGDIGFGTESPDVPLELETTGTAAEFLATRTDGAQAVISAGGSFVFIGAKSNNDFRLLVNDSPQLTLTTDGKVGVGVTTVDSANKLEVDNGARLTTGGTWTNASSIDFKENIKSLTADEAIEALVGLNPVKFNYKAEKDEEYVGFIAEEVPELVAQNDRKGLSPMDVVGVLTKVVQEQQKSLKEQKESIADQQKIISDLNKRIADLEKDSK
jgi:hypothetical protein